jgi:DNA-binding transcriptional MerR regulator
MNDKIFYSIAEVAEQASLPKHVIRFWETEFPEIKPDRRQGRRYYRQGDIDAILKVKDLLYKKGFTIKGAKKFMSDKRAQHGEKLFADFKMDEEARSLEPVQESRILKKYSFASADAGAKVDVNKILKSLAEIEDILKE